MSLPIPILSLLLAPLFSGPPQESWSAGPRQDSPASEVPANREEKLKRVLQLGEGGHLRALCYFSEGLWNLRMDGKWIQLEEASVTSWRPEKELERQATRLRRALGPQDLGQRVELSRWMVQQGLVLEAFEELDSILKLDPDFSPALQVLRSPAFPGPVASGAEQETEAFVKHILAAGISAGPADRELLILSLSAVESSGSGREVLRRTLQAELRSPRVLRRTFAAHALRRLSITGKLEMYALMQRCVLDTSRPVREEASRALRGTGDPGIVLPLLKTLQSESRPVRTNAIESLGNAGFKSAVPALVTHFSNLTQAGSHSTAKATAHISVGTQFAYVGDFDLEIAQAASIADPTVMAGEEAVVLDARVVGVSGYTYRREFLGLGKAMKQLTGASPGSSPDDWQRWYENNRSAFESEEASRTR
jgi:hypothetical protein